MTRTTFILYTKVYVYMPIGINMDKETIVVCPRCGTTQGFRITAGGAQQRCKAVWCSRSITRRHEVI